MAEPHYEIFRVTASCVSCVEDIPDVEPIPVEVKTAITMSDQSVVSKSVIPDMDKQVLVSVHEMSNGNFIGDAAVFVKSIDRVKYVSSIQERKTKVYLPE
jgi:hypothetical protein